MLRGGTLDVLISANSLNWEVNTEGRQISAIAQQKQTALPILQTQFQWKLNIKSFTEVICIELDCNSLHSCCYNCVHPYVNTTKHLFHFSSYSSSPNSMHLWLREYSKILQPLKCKLCPSLLILLHYLINCLEAWETLSFTEKWPLCFTMPIVWSWYSTELHSASWGCYYQPTPCFWTEA